MNDAQEARRLVENEVLARSSNRDAGIAIANLSVSISNIMFFCECSDSDCAERIPMSLTTYRQIHENNNRFTIKPNHDTSKVESVIDRGDKYWVVQKYHMEDKSARPLA